MKAAMEIVTQIKMGPTRQPIKSLDKDERKKIEEVLKDMDIIKRTNSSY